ncbi:HlyD family secretion protein [Falsiroseomonas ponticola]|uniref:HlyD family secretion protein n=1 Tax=Falsiroseomonas ponticola TaxID=2786951 RepID=UPI001931CEBB|nr:HlyD family efflux transporter periplasmic adaptor subunit [Roseomonas ponticola]
MAPRILPPVMIAALLGLEALALAMAGAAQSDTPTEAPVAAMVRQTELRLAPLAGGRLARVAVAPGEAVRRGTLLALLDNPDLVARLGEAEAAAAAARADRDNLLAGTRAEEVAAAARNVETAAATLLLAGQSHRRIAALFAATFASRQQLDEAVASLDKARAELDLMRARQAAALAGATAEQRAVAIARVDAAEAAVATLRAELDKTRVVAPADGIVRVVAAEPGEVIAAGQPVLTLAPAGGLFFSLTLREDALGGLRIGLPVALRDAGGAAVRARVTELRPLGEFATWRAARAVGDHDLNSLRLRLEPEGTPPAALEAGMTLWLPVPR